MSLLVMSLLVSSGLWAVGADPSDVLARGKAIYSQQCAECHGNEGQGAEEFYEDPLVGDATIGELTELISDTMPEEDPDACVAEDAAVVAAFIHQDFYSEAAQIRRRPPRAILSRLTAEQLRQSLADLYGRFGQTPWTENSSGIKGRYFNSSDWKDGKKKIERLDPVLDFDFGRKGPGEGISPEEFYIQWSGSLKVQQTGRYEIILRSTCACVMDFGRDKRELIDNHVQSEGKEEFRKTLHLTGGRSYMFKIDFYQRKRKTEQPPAKISLSWVPPGGVEEVIPERNFRSNWLPPQFALQTKLPPDDRSYGYERGTAINRAWDQSTTAAALEFSQYAINELYPHYLRHQKKATNQNRGKLRRFLGDVVETAFRGPLDDRLRDLYIDRHVDQCEDDAEAIKRVLLITLKSPRFLYPTLDAEQSASSRAANRLTLTMFDSLPSDQWFRDIVRKDKLKDRKQFEQIAWRMVDDNRCRAKTRAFLYEWFDIAHLDEITKDRQAYPDFDAALVSDLKKSFDAFLDEVVSSDSSDFRQLLQADWMFTTDRLAKFYGDAWKPANGEKGLLGRSVQHANLHVGVINHPLLMSDLAYHRTSSPIHRGVFLTRHILGRVLRPPNAAFSPLNPDLHPGLTTRERVELQTGEVSCLVCHSRLNSLGFALENFDATGRFRENENEKPINAAGSYTTRAGKEVTFTGARELGDYLAGSTDCHRSFVEAAFEHFVKQPISAYGPDLSDRLTKYFQDSGFNIRQLIVAIAVIAAEETTQSVPEA